MNQFAQSVAGTLAREKLGKTLMHEHILCDLRDPSTRAGEAEHPPITMENRFQTDYFQNRNPFNMVLDEIAVAERELSLFCSAGGSTIVELSVGGLRPQPAGLRSLSARTGANIIMGAGYYVDAYMPKEIRGSDIYTLEALLQSQLTDGVWDTDIRAGIIGEIGCSWPLEESEHRMLVAAARVQANTGVAITVHPGRHCDAPAQIAKILLAAGAYPERTVIGHMDRTVFDRGRLLDLLQQGFVLEWDFFGIETSQYWMAGCDLDLPTDYTRLDLIHDLMRTGFRRQIAVSHDICTKTRLSAYGGHGYRHLLINIVPMMQRRGWKDAEVEELFIGTPARLLCYLTDETSSCRTQ